MINIKIWIIYLWGMEGLDMVSMLQIRHHGYWEAQFLNWAGGTVDTHFTITHCTKQVCFTHFSVWMIYFTQKKFKCSSDIKKQSKCPMINNSLYQSSFSLLGHEGTTKAIGVSEEWGGTCSKDTIHARRISFIPCFIR